MTKAGGVAVLAAVVFSRSAAETHQLRLEEIVRAEVATEPV